MNANNARLKVVPKIIIDCSPGAAMPIMRHFSYRSWVWIARRAVAAGSFFPRTKSLSTLSVCFAEREREKVQRSIRLWAVFRGPRGTSVLHQNMFCSRLLLFCWWTLLLFASSTSVAVSFHKGGISTPSKLLILELQKHWIHGGPCQRYHRRESEGRSSSILLMMCRSKLVVGF